MMLYLREGRFPKFILDKPELARKHLGGGYDIKTRWSDAEVNLMGVYGKTDSFSRYQVQLERSILYHNNVSTDNTTIINLIEERL